MTQRLAGKVALVTGASKGIGAAIARQLATEGAAVVVNYAASKAGSDRVVAVQADLSQPGDIVRLLAETKQAFGKLDILVNNAGIYEFAPLEAITVEHYRKQFDLNVLGLLLTTKEAVKLFGPEGGNIINIRSVVATARIPASAVYSGTKAAVEAITRSLAAELGPRKIRVNSINPGMVETEGVHSAGIAESDFRKQIESQTPLGRIGQPDDIAKAVAFFASPDASWITGETLYISGGNR
jgi:3-oxoacyl-[acyl-carrier protein] reductase